MTFLAPVGIDTEAEPSAQDLAILIDQLKADGAAAYSLKTSQALHWCNKSRMKRA